MASNQFHLIFVYGSLKREERNYRYLSTDLKPGEHAKLIAECRLKEKYPLVVPRSPCLLNRPGKGKIVVGELYEVDDVVLGKLDQLEAHPINYLRTKTVVVNLEDESEIQCEVYFKIKDVESLMLLPYISNFTGNINKHKSS